MNLTDLDLQASGLIRVDFNPAERSREVTDDTRIRQHTTILRLEQGGSAVTRPTSAARAR